MRLFGVFLASSHGWSLDPRDFISRNVVESLSRNTRDTRRWDNYPFEIETGFCSTIEAPRKPRHVLFLIDSSTCVDKYLPQVRKSVESIVLNMHANGQNSNFKYSLMIFSNTVKYVTKFGMEPASGSNSDRPTIFSASEIISNGQLDLAEQIYYLGKGVNMVNAINHASSHIEDRVDLNQEQPAVIIISNGRYSEATSNKDTRQAFIAKYDTWFVSLTQCSDADRRDPSRECPTRQSIDDFTNDRRSKDFYIYPEDRSGQRLSELSMEITEESELEDSITSGNDGDYVTYQCEFDVNIPQPPVGEEGEDGRDGRPGEPGLQGRAGAPGRDGADGRDGAEGREGPKGSKGQPGIEGAYGSDGEDGEDGPQGPRGEVGMPGEPGDSVRSEPGSRGERGPSGPQGRQGSPGLQGEPGSSGAPGRDGPDGQDGADGPDGSDGKEGPTGYPGLACDAGQGRAGPPGPDGLSGLLGLPGKDGLPGADGAHGDCGEVGSPGIDGKPGPPGDDGEYGEKGRRGLNGINGKPGPMGPTGAQGKSGADGADGEDGLQGPRGETVNGRDGVRGPAGDPGTPGPDGESGEDGCTGKDGLPGFASARGKSGLDGQNGQKGRKGQKGVTGLRGAPGPRGSYRQPDMPLIKRLVIDLVEKFLSPADDKWDQQDQWDQRE